MTTPEFSWPMPTDDRPRPPAPELLLKPLRRLLRPLVRMLIQSGITFPVLADLLRSLYVEIAANDLLTDPRAQTDSRISLMTGVHRKEIRRHREQDTAEAGVPSVVTLSSQVISRWLGSPEYTGPDGQPLALARTPSAAASASFEGLVEAVTRDVRPRAVLDDWLAQGIVTQDGDGLLHLNTTAFIPRQGREEQLFYFARNLHDHLAAATANVLAPGQPPFMDRSVHYDRLSPEAASRLQSLGREAAQRLLLEINRQALQLADADDAASQADPRAADAPTRRVNLGIYVYAEDEDDDRHGPRQ